MNLIYLVFAAVDLAGVFFNLRMLQSCFKDKTKNTFVQRSRMLAIFQVICQATILVMDAEESWNGFDVQPRESCNVFRVMSIIMMVIQACNTTVIMIIYFDHYMGYQYQGCRSSKVKITVAVFFGIIGSIIIWWYSCGSQQIISLKAVKVMCVVSVVFVAFVLVTTVGNIHDFPEGMSTEASTKTCPLLWAVLKEDKTPVSFMTLLLLSFVLILTDVPRLSFHFKELLWLLIIRFAVGIILPSNVCDIINSSYEERNKESVEAKNTHLELRNTHYNLGLVI